MKKTLFLLPLASGVVFAETDLSDLAETDFSNLSHLTIQQNSVEFTMEDTSAYGSVILSQDAITKLKNSTNINKMLFSFNEMDGSTAEHVGVGVSTYSGSAIRVTGALSGTGNISGATTYYTAWPDSSHTMKSLFGEAQYAVLTLGITPTGANEMILTTVNNAGDITHTTWTCACDHNLFTYSGNVTGFSINTGSGLVTEGFASAGTWTHESLQSLGTSVIKLLPEPTTVTLSLLALTGLAARRRRK